MKVLTPSSCVSSIVSPYFFTLVKLSSGYTPRLYRMLQNHQINSFSETKNANISYRPPPRESAPPPPADRAVCVVYLFAA
jgi:hypothetical protein